MQCKSLKGAVARNIGRRFHCQKQALEYRGDKVQACFLTFTASERRCLGWICIQKHSFKQASGSLWYKRKLFVVRVLKTSIAGALTTEQRAPWMSRTLISAATRIMAYCRVQTIHQNKNEALHRVLVRQMSILP